VRAQSKSEKNAGAAAASPLAGLGSASGTVKAPQEFKSAKVYLKNVDKNVVYMVFTDGGRYQAVDLFPGNYEVSVTKNGFTGGDAQKITIAPGGHATADFALKEGTYRPNQQMRSGLPKNEPLVSYDELYPPELRASDIAGIDHLGLEHVHRLEDPELPVHPAAPDAGLAIGHAPQAVAELFRRHAEHGPRVTERHAADEVDTIGFGLHGCPRWAMFCFRGE
jgi:hypothetical protein